MARNNRTRVQDLLDLLQPSVRRAFEQAIRDITSNAELGRIARALEAGDVEGALLAVHLDPAAFRPLDLAIQATFEAGGSYAAGRMPRVDEGGHRLVFRFNVRDLRAETYLQTHSSGSITDIVSDQRAAVRAELQSGLAQGRNPRDTALDIVGRIDRKTGQRSGGVIGLTAQQAAFARNYRAELLSGDPARMANALKRTLRDRRFDARVRAAIDAGKPLDAETADMLVGRYRSSLLRLRGETVARTETLQAIHVGQHEAHEQAIEKGIIKRSQVLKVWSSTGDSRVRDSHVTLDGQRVGMDDDFVSPLTGARLRFPGDPYAPAEEIINCRCVMEYDVDFLKGAALSDRAPPEPASPLAQLATILSAPPSALTPKVLADRETQLSAAQRQLADANALAVRDLEGIVRDLYGHVPSDSVLAGLFGSRTSALVSRRTLLLRAAKERIELVERTLARRKGEAA